MNAGMGTIRALRARAVDVPLARPLQTSGGAVVSDAAGLGIEWDESAVARCLA